MEGLHFYDSSDEEKESSKVRPTPTNKQMRILKALVSALQNAAKKEKNKELLKFIQIKFKSVTRLPGDKSIYASTFRRAIDSIPK